MANTGVLKNRNRLTWSLLMSLLSCILLTSCYGPIKGKVIDAETGEPIEGAVIMVEWTETKGMPGMSNTRSYKVVEVLTDKDGMAEIEGVDAVFVDLARVAVYKKGYVLWSNNRVFKGSRALTNFEWKDEYVFELNRFKPEYSYVDHTRFIHSAISSGFGDKRLIKDAYRWEELEASKERNRIRK